MILTRRFNLDVVPGGIPPTIRVSKKDTSSRLIFSLFAGRGVLDVPADTSAIFQGNGASTSALFSIVNAVPTVKVDLTRAMTSKVGFTPFEIVLISGIYKLVTATLYLDIKG